MCALATGGVMLPHLNVCHVPDAEGDSIHIYALIWELLVRDKFEAQHNKKKFSTVKNNTWVV
jgi:hypothetical protein